MSRNIKTLIVELKELAEWDDIERAHIKADSIICEALLMEDLDRVHVRELLKAYHEVEKWYA